MDAALTQRPVGRVAIILGLGLYHVIIACEMLQCIHNQNKHDMAQQVPRSKHTLSLITAVWAGCSAEALCLFCSGLSCRGRGTLEWLHLTRSSLHKLRRQTKEDAWLPTGAKTDPEISSSLIGGAGKGMMTDCGIFLCGFFTLHSQMIYDIHLIWLQD